MKIYKSSGDVVTIVAPQPIASNDFVKVGALHGFAQSHAAEGDSVAVVTRGTFTASVAADAGEIIVGQKIFATSNGILTAIQNSGSEVAQTADHDYVGYAVTYATAGEDGFAAVDIRIA